METTDPIQQLLIDARRTQILDAATRVFAAKGFHRATIKDIARAAGIGDGTIYNYFDSKADVLIGIMDRLNETEQRAEQLALSGQDDFRSFFVTYLRHRLAVLWPNQEVLQALLPEILTNAGLRQRYYEEVIRPSVTLAENYFQQQVGEGRLRPLSVAMATRVMAGAVFGVFLIGLLGDEYLQTHVQDIPGVLAAMLLDGIMAGNR